MSFAKDRVTLQTLRGLRRKGRPIVMVTAYDHPTARLADEAGVDCILVGDSLGMVCLGYEDTTRVTMDDMVHHTKAVARARPRAFVVADMPMGSYGVRLDGTVTNALRLVQDGGADAVKLEGGAFTDEVRALSAIGIAVVGHLGFTPQSIGRFGGFRVRGRGRREADELVAAARGLEDAGAVMVVLECEPRAVAAEVTAALTIPTVGIGAGPDVDGQVLVFHDLVGFCDTGFAPRFLKRYDVVRERLVAAVAGYAADVRSRVFPAAEHCYGAERPGEEAVCS